MNHKAQLSLHFIHNFIFDNLGARSRVKISIKSFLFFAVILSLLFTDVEVGFQKKKKNRISILNAPYKNKLAQRQYYIERNFFFIKISSLSSASPQALEALIENLGKLRALGSFFFYLTKLRVRVRTQ